MRRLSQNLVTMTLLMNHRDLQRPKMLTTSGTFLQGAGEMTRNDKLPSRFQNVLSEPKLTSMKAAVPCLVLGSTFVSTAVLVIVSCLLFN
jgi:hypothetical protein